MKTKKEKTSNQPKALTAEQNKAAAEHALKLKVEKEAKELEDIKKTMDEQEEVRKAKEVDPKAEPKAEPKKEKKVETKKEPKPETMAEYLDKLITTGGTWEELVKAAQAEAEKKGQKSKLSRGTIQGHLNYRIKKDENWLKERNLTVAEDGIAKGK